MTGQTSRPSSRVLGRLDEMTAFSGRSELRAEDIATYGLRANAAIDLFNSLAESQFQVWTTAAEALVGLGHALNDLDSFVSEIAGLMRTADSGVISLQVAEKAVGNHLGVSSNLERTANDLATATLAEHLDYLDTIQDGYHSGIADGKVSQNDLREALKRNPDAALASAIRWLLAHPKVFKSIDTNHAYDSVTEDGRVLRMVSDFEDDLVDLDEIRNYEARRQAYRTVIDNFEAFDSAATGKLDGKVSGADFRVVVTGNYSVAAKRAAQFLLDNPNGMNGYLHYKDDIAGLYDLDRVAKSYGEPRRPLPPQNTGLRQAVCGVAGYYSYLGWADLVLEGNPNNALQEAGARSLGLAAVTTSSAKAAKSFSVAKVVVGGNVYIGVAATVVDGVCRFTDPNAVTWGKIKPLKSDPPTAKPAVPPTPKWSYPNPFLIPLDKPI